MSRADRKVLVYEAPQLTLLGSVYATTQTGGGGDWPCIWGKTIGSPDYWQQIPISNCSP
jgi:hypothetical protein